MATHRRQFIKTAGIFGFSLGIPAIGKSVIGSTAARVLNRTGLASSSNIYKKATFVPHLNSTFRVHSGPSTVDMKLVKIIDIKAEARKPSHIKGSENFSLIFKASRRAAGLGDNVYELNHADLGIVPLFLVGVGRLEGARTYEAVVSRL